MVILEIIISIMIIIAAIKFNLEPQWILLYASIYCAGLMASERN